ncbi:MAG TPA: glycoside hydrolase family 38 C-terminal domain-containing protein, partial [Gemmatimonadales bacterium]
MSTRLTFHLIPHTHWDREWYLPRAAFQARLIPVLEALLLQLEQEPAARFVLDGQTVLVEDFLAARPDLADRVAAQVGRGALEIGPWYVLADELIPTGESLLRNLLEGGRDAARWGRRLDVLYSPDAFGHPGALPALAREFGIEAGVAWRGVGRPGGSDRDLYHWGSPADGGLLLYHLPREGYSIGAELATAVQDLRPRWTAVRKELVARSVTSQVAVFVGADHHAAAPDLAGLRERLQAFEPEHEVRISGLAEFFASVVEAGPSHAKSGPAIPALGGELRRIDDHAWVLQGVHGTRTRMKRRHSVTELTVSRLAEPLATLSALRGGIDHRGVLRLAWRSLLQSQFHDTLGGCSADDVAREQDVRLSSVEALIREIGARSWRDLAGHDPDLARVLPDRSSPALILWNPCARIRRGIVTAELSFFRSDVLVGPPGGRVAATGTGYRPVALEAASGERLPLQVIGMRPGQERLDADHHYPDQDLVDRVFVAFQPPPLAGLALRRFHLRTAKGLPRASGLDVKPDLISNRLIAARVSPIGVITLEDRRSGERYPGLGVLEDEPDGGDSYTFSRGRGRTALGGRHRSRAIIAGGPLVGAIETRWTMASATQGDLEFRLVAVLHADSPILRLRLDVENGARDHRLRARFPVGAGEDACAGAAFGLVLRPPVHRQRGHESIELPDPTAPAHRFAAAAEYTRGLAILAPGFFQYEWTADRDLLVTLIRSVGELSKPDLPERPGHAGWPQPTPLAQEPGDHSVQLAVVPIGEADLDRPDRLMELWEDAFLPVQSGFFRRYARNAGAQPERDDGIQLEGDGLVLSAIKRAEQGEGLVLRCYNITESPVEGRWVFAGALREAWLLRADETGALELSLPEDRRSVPFSAGA